MEASQRTLRPRQFTHATGARGARVPRPRVRRGAFLGLTSSDGNPAAWSGGVGSASPGMLVSVGGDPSASPISSSIGSFTIETNNSSASADHSSNIFSESEADGSSASAAGSSVELFIMEVDSPSSNLVLPVVGAPCKKAHGGVVCCWTPSTVLIDMLASVVGEQAYLHPISLIS